MEAEVTCPYCGEGIAIWIDLSAGDEQRYIEDCSVCCRPIEIDVLPSENGEPSVTARRGGD